MREPRPGSFLDRLTDRDTPLRTERIARVTRDLVPILGETRVLNEYATRRIYSRDLIELPVWLERFLFRTTPHVVVQPLTSDEVRAVCEIARRRRLPVIPRGVGSWAYGGAVPTTGGIVFDLSLMDAIAEVDRDQGVVAVDPGARWGVLDEHVSACGFSLPVTPSNRMATVGGWVATGGYGLGATGRGHLRRWVRAIEVVTIDGAVARLEPSDADFALWFGSEGQYGFVTRVWLKLLPRSPVSEPKLFTFESDDDALAFLSKLLESGARPEHAKFLDAAHMTALNTAHGFRGRAHGVRKIVPEGPSVLLHFSDAESLDRFERARATLSKWSDEAPLHVASYLWNARFHPMHIQVLGPSLLASEHVMPLAAYPAFIRRIRDLAERFGVTLFLEGTPVLRDDTHEILSIASFACDRRRALRHAMLLLLVQMLGRAGIRQGGRPYGVGIWNVPFFGSVHPRGEGRARLQVKRRLDPSGVVNPRKFHATRTRFWNVPGVFFRPPVYKACVDMALFMSRFLGQFSRAMGLGPLAEKSPLERWAAECTNCGNCVSVCPAYQVTGHEGTTGRQKLKVGLRALYGGKVSKEESDRAFLCVYCNACTDICQTGIPLTRAYEEIEALLEPLHGRPSEKIEVLVGSLGTNERYLRLIDSVTFESDPMRGRRRAPRPVLETVGSHE